MKPKRPKTVQVLLEGGLHATATNAPPSPGTRRRGALKAFTYTRGSGDAGRFRELDEARKTHPAGCTVGVFAFAKTGELGRARKLVKEYSRPHKAMIAVTSPAVFNNPAFRSVLSGNHVEVLVEEKKKRFQVKHLGPWVSKLAESLEKDGPESGTNRAPDPLDISKRLRSPASGRLDALKFVELFGISGQDLASKICGVKRQNIHQNPTSAGIQEKLQPLEEIAQLLHWCGGDEEKLRAWLRRPNRDFPPVDGKTPSPMDLILRGHAGIVADKVNNLLTGHPA